MRAALLNECMEILLQSKDFIVIKKPAGMPSQHDPSGDIDAMTLASEMLKASGERGDLYLIHRLDRVVGGLLVFARNKKSAAELSKLVSGYGIGKEYLAVIDGYLDGGTLTDYLYKDARASKAFVVDKARAGVKEAVLSFEPLSRIETEKGVRTLVRITLKTGRFHQIRAQFSSRKAPICGDGKYGSKDNRSRFPALFAYKLSFDLFGKVTEVKALPDISEYPWCLFEKSVFGENVL